MAVDLQPYKINIDDKNYPSKHNDALDHMESEINSGLDQITANLDTLSSQITTEIDEATGALSLQITGELDAAVAVVEGYRDQAAVSATTATTQAGIATTKAAEGSGYADNALNSQNQAAASAGLAAEIANIPDVQKFTALASPDVIALFTGGSSSITGIQIPSNTQNNHGVNDFTLHWKGYLPSYTGETRTLRRKHNTARGYILDILTDKKIRLTLNGFTYTSTVAATLIDGDINEVEAAITRETAAATGQVIFIVNGAQVGDAVTILAEPTDPILDIDFSTDPALVFTSMGSAVWNSGAETVTVSCVAGSFSSMVIDPFERVNGRTYRIEIKTSGSVGSGSWRLSNTGGTHICQFGNSDQTFVAYSADFDRDNLYLQRAVASGDYSMDIEYIKITPWPSMDNLATEYIMGSSSTQTAGGWLRSLTYNRAISALESLQRIKRGIPLSDLGMPGNRASQVPVYESDFSAGVDGWSPESGVTLTGNQDGIDGENDWLSAQRTGGNDALRLSISGVLAKGLWGEVSGLKVNNPTVATRYVGLYVTVNPSTVSRPAADAFVEIPAGETRTIADVTAIVGTGAGEIYISSVDASGEVATVGTGTELYFKGVSAKRVGITGLWSAEHAQSDTGQVLDQIHTSHALLPSSGATRIPQNLRPVIESPSAHSWTATDEIQYVAGNQALMSSDDSFLVIDVESDTAFDLNVGDGNDPDRFVAAYTLSIGKNRLTIANPFNDGTNRKLTVQPVSSVTASITVHAEMIKERI